MSLATLALNGTFVLLAGLFALGPRTAEERRQLMLCWLVVAVGWGLYAASWSPVSPHRLLARIGLAIPSPEIWTVSDVSSAVMVLIIAHNRLWGFMLWCFLGAQVVGHEAQRLFPADFAPYTAYLDLWWRAQLVLFAVVGGPGVWTVVDHYTRRLRDGLGKALAAQPAAARSRPEGR